jgi:hypothetical protein
MLGDTFVFGASIDPSSLSDGVKREDIRTFYEWMSSDLKAGDPTLRYASTTGTPNGFRIGTRIKGHDAVEAEEHPRVGATVGGHRSRPFVARRHGPHVGHHMSDSVNIRLFIIVECREPPSYSRTVCGRYRSHSSLGKVINSSRPILSSQGRRK